MSIDLSIERRIGIPPAACFSLLSDPMRVRDWWGPNDEDGVPFRAHVHAWTVLEGEHWSIDMTAPDGTVYSQRGRMLEVDPPSTLRFSFSWVEDDKAGPETVISFSRRPDGNGSLLTFTQAGFCSESVRDSHLEGWNECLDRLQEFAHGHVEGVR
jgi:uncharacterized protein YndB with AHSA1/START domain